VPAQYAGAYPPSSARALLRTGARVLHQVLVLGRVFKGAL
jgi:hypothetical protein